MTGSKTPLISLERSFKQFIDLPTFKIFILIA